MKLKVLHQQEASEAWLETGCGLVAMWVEFQTHSITKCNVK